MEPPSSPSSPLLPRRRSHLRSATAGSILRLLSLFPAGLPGHHAPAPPPSDPSPQPDSGGSPAGGAVPEEAGEILAGSSDVGVVVGVRKEEALSDGGIGWLRESAGGDGRFSLDCGGIGAEAMVNDDEGGILPIEVGLDCSISSGLLLGDLEVEDMILDQDQAAGENGEVEREDCPDSRIEDWAKKEDRIGAVEKQIAGNVVEDGLRHPGIVLDTYKNVESCKPEEVAACKHTDICAAFDEDKEIEEGEIPGEVDLSMLLSDQDIAVVHDIDRKQACLSATKEYFGPVELISNARSLSSSEGCGRKVQSDVSLSKRACLSATKEDFGPVEPISNARSLTFSEGCGRKVQSDVSLSKRANVVEMNSGYGGSCISKEENICESRGREKREVTNGVVVSPQKDGVRLKKKKQASVSDQKKAKKKIAKKRRRAEINKKLGVKRLKLVPISKPKVVKICKHYLHGRCQQGDECKFSHDAVPFTKSQPCKHFARDSCLKGDDCPFDHELFKYPCHNYMYKGSCFRGDSCLFSHKVQLSQDNSNDSEVKCRGVPERASLGKDCQRDSKTPLAINTLSRAGTSPSTTSTLQKSSLTQQPNDLFSAKKLDPYVMKTPPKGITFLSFCSDTTSNEFSNNRKETGSTPTFKNMSEGKMPSLFTSLHSPSSSHKMLMPLEVNNFASSSCGNEGNDFITQSAAPKLQSSHMDASQMLEEFLFSGG